MLSKAVLQKCGAVFVFLGKEKPPHPKEGYDGAGLRDQIFCGVYFVLDGFCLGGNGGGKGVFAGAYNL